MATERSRRSEFAQFMAHHIFRDNNTHVLPSVVYHKGKSYKFGYDRAGPSPGFDGGLCPVFNLFIHLLVFIHLVIVYSPVFIHLVFIHLVFIHLVFIHLVFIHLGIYSPGIYSPGIYSPWYSFTWYLFTW